MLQTALRIKPVDGDFGPQTRAAVVRYQKARRLKRHRRRHLRGLAGPRASTPRQARGQAGPEARAQAGAQAQALTEARTEAQGRAEARTQGDRQQARRWPASSRRTTRSCSRSAPRDRPSRCCSRHCGSPPPTVSSGRRPRQRSSPTRRQKKLTADGVVRSAGCGARSAPTPPRPGPKPAASFTLTGSGFGHGVGMSQYGAYAQALAGPHGRPRSCRRYYPGTTRTTSRTRRCCGSTCSPAPPPSPSVSPPPTAPRGTVYGRVTGASKAVTFTAKDTVVVRPNSRGGQDVAARRQGGRVHDLRHRPAARHVDRHPGLAGRAATVQVTGTAVTAATAGQAYRYGEMAISRTGSALNLVNVLRLGDEYVRGVPESPFYWGPHGAAALQAQALAARTFAYTAYRAGVLRRRATATSTTGR